MAQTQSALRQLLGHCMFARRAEALALLDLQPGLLNLGWKGGYLQVSGKVAWPGTTALMMAAKCEDLALVLALLERGADLHERDVKNSTALIEAAYRARNPEVCELLLSRGADLLAESNDGETALEVYGIYSWPRLTVAETEEGRERLRVAWANGAHPSQVERRRDERWARRWPFMKVMVLGGFQPLAARLAALKETALPTDVALPSPPNNTPAQRLALLRAKVWSHPGIWRAIAAFL